MSVALFNPHIVLELIQLSQEDLSWLLEEARQGRAWGTLPGRTPAALHEILSPVWLAGADLWEESSAQLRDEHLQPAVPFWENLLLGWAQVRLRTVRTDMNRRDIAWAAVVKAFIVGIHPDFPGSSDYFYKHGRDRIFQLAETLGVVPITTELGGAESREVNEGFTRLAFGMTLDMLLDPDRDMLLGRINRAIGLLDKAKQFVKSEDMAQARKLLAEIADVKALSPGVGLKLKGTLNYSGFQNACNAGMQARRDKGEDMNPAIVAAHLQLDADYIRDFVAGKHEGTLEDAETRLLAFMIARVIGFPVLPYIR